MDTQGITTQITRMDMVRSQAYHKNTYRFRGISQEHTEFHMQITRTHTVSHAYQRTHTGSQAYHKNTHSFTGISQEHIQVHRCVTRMDTLQIHTETLY